MPTIASTSKLGIIVDAEGTRANRTDEIAVTETMIERVERRFGLAPERLAGDTAYGAARLLKWLWDRGIAPHVPVWDKSKQTGGRFTKEDFVFDHDRNVYICPAGAELTHSGIIDQGRILPYRAITPIARMARSSRNVQRRPPVGASSATSTRTYAIGSACLPANTEAFQVGAANARKSR